MLIFHKELHRISYLTTVLTYLYTKASVSLLDKVKTYSGPIQVEQRLTIFATVVALLSAKLDTQQQKLHAYLKVVNETFSNIVHVQSSSNGRNRLYGHQLASVS